MKENKIPAVYKEDLSKLLSSIGENDPILNGERTCMVCSKIITFDNLQLIIPKVSNEFNYVCNDSECISKFNTLTEG